jgi:uncharacterized protein YfkK (UPF0435 family)
MESKNTELEFQMEEFKSNLEVQNKQLAKDLKVTKEHEVDLIKKYEALKKKYELESDQLKANNENSKQLNDERMNQLETTLKET